MLTLSGWLGAPSANQPADSTRQVLARAAGPACPTAAGPGWACFAGDLAEAEGIVVVLKGTPVWGPGGGAPAAGRCDARSLLRDYRQHGADCVTNMHGAFAVAIIDTTSNQALLAVDRFGIESLSYAHSNQGLVFATSTETVARAAGPTARLNPQAILSYLFFHMIPSPETIYAGVRKVPPATIVELSGGKLSERRYWIPGFATAPGAGFPALKSALHQALELGVRATQPDDSAGAFLSGGLDSSTVVGYLGKVSGRPAQTFSMGFGFDDYDELRYAHIANRHFGSTGHEYQVQPRDIVEMFPAIARAYDEPFGNASALPTYCCARLARQHGVTHLLAGDGGDELFAGNKRYSEQLVFERYQQVPGIFRKALLEPVLAAWPASLRFALVRKARNYVAQANTPMPDRLETWNLLHRSGFAEILHPDFAPQVDLTAPARHMRAVYDSAPETGFVNRMLYYDWRFTLADNDLRKVGRMCELAGVKVSFPLLHPQVVDVATQVPAELMMRGTELRTFYKQAMADFLPEEIIRKTKHGFGLPFGLWLEQSPDVAALINGNLASLRTRGLIRPEFIDRLLELHGQQDARYYGVFIWLLAMLEQWFQEHRLAP